MYDVVYTYVNGNDTQYKHTYSKQTNEPINDIRCLDHGEIIFSVQLLLRHMGWIRTIYIVHAGHTMDQSTLTALEDMVPCGRLCIVPQTDILPDLYRDTVCSCTVEAFLHKLPNLSDYFFYMNDDMFIGRPLTINDWVVDCVPQLDVSVRQNPIDSNQAQQHNTNAFHIFCKKFGRPAKILKFRVSHQTALMSRRACELAHEHFGPELERQFKLPYRTAETINFQLLATLMAHQFGLGQLRYFHIYRGWLLVMCDFQSDMLQFIQAHMPHLFCINSVNRENESTFRAFRDQYIAQCDRRVYPIFPSRPNVSNVLSARRFVGGNRARQLYTFRKVQSCGSKPVCRVFDMPRLPKQAPCIEAGFKSNQGPTARARGNNDKKLATMPSLSRPRPGKVDICAAKPDGHAAVRAMWPKTGQGRAVRRVQGQDK